MKILDYIKDLFKPVDCYCQCHFGGFDKNAVEKGSYRVVTCKHCLKVKVNPKIKKWGTAVPF
jgi:hypothetical protein